MNLATSDVAVARAAIADAKAQLQQETATLDFHTLAAPYDAMVTARLKELGSALGAGEPVFTLIDPKSVWVLAFIDESKAGEIAVGKPADIVLRSRPNQRFSGQVARIEPESDRVNEERRVAIAFDQAAGRLPSGRAGRGLHHHGATCRRRCWPRKRRLSGSARIAGRFGRVEDGRLQQHEVTLGHRLLDGRYEITGGVPDKALVVTQLRSGLRVGRAAKIAEGPSR